MNSANLKRLIQILKTVLRNTTERVHFSQGFHDSHLQLSVNLITFFSEILTKIKESILNRVGGQHVFLEKLSVASFVSFIDHLK